MLYRIIKQYYKSIIIGLLITWLSLSGSKTMVPGRMLDIPYIDKIGHFAMYAFFSAILLLDSCRWQLNRSFIYPLILIPLIFGAIMEIMQMTLTTSRKAETFDLLANVGGVLTGLLAAYLTRMVLARFRA